MFKVMKDFEVLLIDDNDIDNYISNHVIESTHLAKKITAKSSALDALVYLKSIEQTGGKFPDIVFLDVRMPKMDGFDFLEKFNEFPESLTRACKVILLTSSMHPDDKVRARQNPLVKKFLNKPLTSELVESLVKL